jgi:C-terminal processing protease CtpA/Prc
LLVCAAPLRAQEDTLLDALNHDEYPVREQATADLLADETLTAKRIDALFADAWSPEQRHRLVDIARHHFIRDIIRTEFGHGEQGSLGVTISPGEIGQVAGLNQPGVFITRTHPGFPAYTKLKTDDLILAVNGNAPGPELTGGQLTSYLIERIKGYAAGEHVAMTIYRDGARHEVDIQLASRAALDAIYQQDPPMRVQAAAIINGQLQVEPQIARQVLADKYGPPQMRPDIEARWLKRRTELERLAKPR